MKVVVLGAGIIGTSSAYFLAKQGHDVTVIDRQDGVSMETSHANAGSLSYGFSSPWASPGLPLNLLNWFLTGRSPLVINPNISIETIRCLPQFKCRHKSTILHNRRYLQCSSK